jgi:hypothetical protein
VVGFQGKVAITHAKRRATAATVGSLRRERHTVVTRAVSAEAPPKQKAAPANGAGDKIRVGINGAKNGSTRPFVAAETSCKLSLRHLHDVHSYRDPVVAATCRFRTHWQTRCQVPFRPVHSAPLCVAYCLLKVVQI